MAPPTQQRSMRGVELENRRGAPFPPSYSRLRSGFTLIELLIVIAIILILIAIALPNFLEAQIRARVTKSRGEIRTLKVAMEAYFLDWKRYPNVSFPNYTVQPRQAAGLTWLTSPNAYITSIPEDPFPGELDPEGLIMDGPPYGYVLLGVEAPFTEVMLTHPHSGGTLKAWSIFSLGPDSPQPEMVLDHDDFPTFKRGMRPIHSYSPTNGSKSKGDIFVYGGDPRWMGVAIGHDGIADDGKFREYNKPGVIINGVLYVGRFPPEGQ